MKFSKILRLLRNEAVVGVDIFRKKVLLKRYEPVPLENDYEYEIVGEVQPFFLYKLGCSPHFGTGGKFYTAQHCIGINNTGGTFQLYDNFQPDGYTNVVESHPWKPASFWCIILSTLAEILHINPDVLPCMNKDWAVYDKGNESPIEPVGVLSGGNSLNYTAIAPLVSDPLSFIGKKLWGIALDYNEQKFVRAEYKVIGYGYVKYIIDFKPYIVEVWHTEGFSKPGYSGTNLFDREWKVLTAMENVTVSTSIT